MNESLLWEVTPIVEQVVALFVEPCPLCGKKPSVEMFHRTKDCLLGSEDTFDLQEERWRLRIACWDNDLPRDEICMLKTATGGKAFKDAVLFSVRSWNDANSRAAIRKQCLGKSYEERCQIPRDVVSGIHNGAPNVEWMKEEIRGWLKDLP